MLDQRLKDLIDARGEDLNGRKALIAQVILQGGTPVQGAIMATDDGLFTAIGIVADQNRNTQMIEWHFDGDAIMAIMLPASEDLRAAYIEMVGANKPRIHRG